MPFFLDHELHPFYKNNPQARKQFVGLVGCSNKRIQHRPCKARDMYCGALAKMSIRWLDRNCEKWFIISPVYHLLEPDQIIEPYKGRVSDMPEEDIISWAQIIQRQLREKVGFKTPFLILAGAEYANNLRLPKRYRVSKHFKLLDPCQNTIMGMRMHWLRTHPVLSRKVVRMIKHGEALA